MSEARLAGGPGPEAFCAALAAVQRRSELRQVLVQVGLPFGCVLAAALLVSTWLFVALLPFAATVFTARLLRAARLDHRRQGVLALATVAGSLGDQLATWDQVRDGRAKAAEGMLAWLGHDLQAAVAAAPPPSTSLLPRRWFGPARYLLPVLLVLLLILCLLPTLRVPGVRGGGLHAPAAAVVPGAVQALVLPQPRSLRPPPSPQEPPPPPEPPRANAEPAAPAPMLDLPSLPTVVVPQFTGDGPTRRALAERALVEQEAEAAARRHASPGAGAEPPPAPGQDAFRRAAERAQQSRHVPERERAIVRRYFELLQQGR